MPDLTIFSAPKPFIDPHIATIQNNAIRSWTCLGSGVEVYLVGQEEGLAEAAAELEVGWLPQVERNREGTPLVSSIFEVARRASQAPLLAYVNADILLLPDFVETALKIAGQVERFLVVGQRWDLEVRQELDYRGDWAGRLQELASQRGRLHPPGGSDYFIYPRGCFEKIPPFAIGRAGWDNWMIFHARQGGWPVIDATGAIQIIHQDHDYSHLPGGQSHYRLPETAENIRLAGGRRAIFSLADASHRIEAGQVRPIPARGRKLVREIETYPLVRLKSKPLAELFFAAFHPTKAWGEWRGRISYMMKRG
jgi:hypothetical protein